ncbi:hypothetical protein ACQ7CU_23975 [Chryseobacterium arthrosphaerae]|uniref:hypothetical protein n=1 Tax=Chryseobacterium arthrosphaerae TaxID=651561 RepID=UPI003D33A272
MGNITEIAGGKISERSSQEIENNAGSFISNLASNFVRQKGDQKGVTYNIPPANKKELKNSIKGVAIFRRKADYNNKPDFGFDWYAGNKYGTTYNEPYDFEDNKTVLSGRNKLQKEYTSFIKYIPIRELGYMEAGKNSGGSIINLNGKIYFVPWFSAFAKDDSGNSKSYELDVFFNIEEPVEGTINISSKSDEIEVAFIDSGDTFFNIDESHPKLFSKTIRISFLDYISDHSSIILTFHKKSEEEKAEEKKRQDEIASGKTPTGPQTIYVSAGELLGILNVYNNSVEYEVVFRYVKVFFKGWIYIENFEDKVYLSGASVGYQENRKLAEREKNLTRGIANLRSLQSSLQNVGNSIRVKEIEDIILKQEKELQDIKDLVIKRQKISTDLYNEQMQAINRYTSFISNNKQSLIDMMSQPLIRYKEKNSTNYEQLEIDVENIDSFFHDLKLKKGRSSHYIVNDNDKEFNSGRIRDKINDAFKSNETKDKKELIIFLLPFGIKSKNNTILLGKAEDVSYKADSAMLTPQADASTFIHEAGHTFNLPHTFLKRGGSWLSEGITLEQGTTDNIMDYDYNFKNNDTDPSNDVNLITNKISLWKFQWDIMRKDPNLIELVKK